MRPAAKLFYLTVFSLWHGDAHCKSAVPRESEEACDVRQAMKHFNSTLVSCFTAAAVAAVSHSSNSHTRCSIASPNVTPQITPNALVSDACVTYESLETLNHKVKPAIDDLTRNTDFFSHYRLNLFSKTCPFWDDNSGMCGNIACAVSTIDDEADIPLVWRAEELSKLEGPKAEHPGRKAQKAQRPLRGSLGDHVGESCVVEYDDECDERDYCVPEDESASAKGEYVSLVANPERFTGYAGDSAKMVWDAIYRHNCFKKSSFPNSAGLGMSSMAKGPAAQDFRAVLQSAGRQQLLDQQRSLGPETNVPSSTGLEYDDECLEKRVFFRVVSGMHTSISTHICWDYLNQTTGEWEHNAQCYVDRVHSHPERVANMYFNYALVTRAITKIGPYLQDYKFCSGDQDQDSATKAKVSAVVQAALKQPEIFDESLMFKNGEGPSLKQEFKDNFRNISRIMDCTGCDKCRLWGKLQVAGYGAALKVLFEFDNDSGEIPALKRTELVALFNLYARLSSSVNAVTKFRAMIETGAVAEEVVKEKVSSIPDRAKKPHAVSLDSQAEARPTSESNDEWEGLKTSASSSQRESQDTLADDDEFGKILAVFKYIMTSFVYLPKFTWHIFLYEVNRGWRRYIGLYVPPRESYLHWPDLDVVYGHKLSNEKSEPLREL